MDPAGKRPVRATITDRVAELLGEQPWPGYDAQSSDAVATRLDAVDVDTARQVRSYERDHGNRSDVIQAADRRIDRGCPSPEHDTHTLVPAALGSGSRPDRTSYGHRSAEARSVPQ